MADTSLSRNTMNIIRNIKIFVAAILLVSVQSFAGYFLEQSPEESQAKDSLSTFSFGGEFGLEYYVGKVHPGISLGGEFRFHNHHSADLFASAMFGGEYFQFGLDWRFFFRGTREDDFLRLGVSMISFERDDKSYFPPRVMLGYGRDILFFKNTSFLCRLEFLTSYIIGKALSEKDGVFTRDAHFTASLNIGIYLF